MADGETSDKPTVAVTSEEVSAVVRSLGVEVDASRVNRAFDRAYRDLAKSSQLKGFRRGKAPRSVLARVYGPQVAEQLEQTIGVVGEHPVDAEVDQPPHVGSLVDRIRMHQQARATGGGDDVRRHGAGRRPDADRVGGDPVESCGHRLLDLFPAE